MSPEVSSWWAAKLNRPSELSQMLVSQAQAALAERLCIPSAHKSQHKGGRCVTDMNDPTCLGASPGRCRTVVAPHPAPPPCTAPHRPAEPAGPPPRAPPASHLPRPGVQLPPHHVHDGQHVALDLRLPMVLHHFGVGYHQGLHPLLSADRALTETPGPLPLTLPLLPLLPPLPPRLHLRGCCGPRWWG